MPTQTNAPSKNSVVTSVLSCLLIGTIAAIDNIGLGLAIASLLFVGVLNEGLGIGVSLFLAGGIVLSLFVAIRSSLPNSVALVQETTIAVLAAAVASMVATLTGPADVKIATAIAIVGVSTLATGFILWLTGFLGLGRMARFLPYPVLAGFLAGSGWLLVDGAFSMVTGQNLISNFLSTLQDSDVLFRLGPAVLLAICMTVGLRRLSHPATVPGLMLIFGLLFHVALYGAQVDIETAQKMGHLPNISAMAGLILPDAAMVARIDWWAVIALTPSIVSIAVLSMIGLLLNISGLELTTGRSIDLNRELRVNGIANLIAGSFGGASGYTDLSVTALSEKLGITGRGIGFATAALMTVGLFFAGPLISHVPVFLTAGFILFLGLELLKEWLIDSRSKLPFAEWMIVLVILAAVVFIGFIEALAVGLIVSIGVFVFNYARLPVIHSSASGLERRSTIDRSPAAMRHLSIEGDAIALVQLQGYLFFGTAERIVDHVRWRMTAKDRVPLRFLILDFHFVGGVDSAATSVFIKIRSIIGDEPVKVFLTRVPDDVLRALQQAGITFGEGSIFALDIDIDHAIEKAEEVLLLQQADAEGGVDLIHHLEAAIGPQKRLADFVHAMTRLSLEKGDILIKAGEEADDVFFISHGRVRVQVALPNGKTKRLRSMTDGAIVGEMALFLKERRSADVVVETPCVVFKLSAERLKDLERDDPELALLAHKLMANNLSQKLVTVNRLIQTESR